MDCGEPVVKSPLLSGGTPSEPFASGGPEGPETLQCFTPLALQDIDEGVLTRTRVGLALIETTGVLTFTVTPFVVWRPFVPVHVMV